MVLTQVLNRLFIFVDLPLMNKHWRFNILLHVEYQILEPFSATAAPLQGFIMSGRSFAYGLFK